MTKICVSCGKKVETENYWVEFDCPECGKEKITRCERCRRLANVYKCTKCKRTYRINFWDGKSELYKAPKDAPPCDYCQKPNGGQAHDRSNKN